jgi:hypothetical protein
MVSFNDGGGEAGGWGGGGTGTETGTGAGSGRGRTADERRQPDLPAGIVQADCDGVLDSLADISTRQLWAGCSGPQRQEIAERFAQNRDDDIRDALLAAEDSRQSGSKAGAAANLGTQLWKVWALFRDQSVEDLHRRGRLRLDFSHFEFEEAPCRSRP